MRLTNRLELAICKAAYAHAEQKRKGGGLPYIIHPFSTMLIASETTQDEDVLIACLLHDVIEDVPERYPIADMQADFGDRVLEIVKGVTKNDDLKDWKARSVAYLDHLENNAFIESVTVSCADKIHNLMSMLKDYETVGEDLWNRFHAGKEQQLWWYQSVLKVCKKRAPDLSLNSQLEELVQQLTLV